jgi:hypothetical protein
MKFNKIALLALLFASGSSQAWELKDLFIKNAGKHLGISVQVEKPYVPVLYTTAIGKLMATYGWISICKNKASGI